MRKRLKQVVVAVLVLFIAAQFVRPARANPPTDEKITLQAQMGASSALPAVVGRACGDCHSNATVWPSYTQVAPLSWAMAYAVKKGRATINFSEWAAYPPERQRELLAASCSSVSAGKMPGGIWTSLHPETRLSPQDIALFCSPMR